MSDPNIDTKEWILRDVLSLSEGTYICVDLLKQLKLRALRLLKWRWLHVFGSFY